MAEFTIVLGNKNYSSWSLRAWLALKQTGADFDEVMIPFRHADTKERILAESPSGKVPILRHDDFLVWDSLAIGEYLAERFPEAGLWPREPEARARARSVTAEMHAGFPALRRQLPMDCRTRRSANLDTPRLAGEIARIIAVWEDCRSRFGGGGDFLFGGFCLADAAFAPVVSRFVTYGVNLDGPAARYRDNVMAWPAMAEWLAAAQDEPWIIDFPELEASAPRR